MFKKIIGNILLGLLILYFVFFLIYFKIKKINLISIIILIFGLIIYYNNLTLFNNKNK